MVVADTNVWARSLPNDDPIQSQTARKALTEARSSEGIFVPLIVLAELAWVLRTRWKRESVLIALEGVLHTGGVSVENPALVQSALAATRQGKGGFADQLIAQVGFAAAQERSSPSTTTSSAPQESGGPGSQSRPAGGARKRVMRKRVTLLFKWSLVALFHISYLFAFYGIKASRFIPGPYISAVFAWLGISTALAFSFYFLLLLRSGLMRDPMRRIKVASCSAVASLLSLYCGVFLCLNTFGE